MRAKTAILLLFLFCSLSLEGTPESPYSVTFFVDAPHFNYSSNRALLNSIVKNGGKLGHAWIELQGLQQGRKISIECGHSGELGLTQAKYFDGIMNYNDYGYANPTQQQRCTPRYEPNPIRYLWAIQSDGYCEKGSGGHRPTFFVKFPLSQEQFFKIYEFITKKYDFKRYSLTNHQCCTFITEIAALINVYLDCRETIRLDSSIWYRGAHVRFWDDECYSNITIPTPDRLEKGLKKLIN